MGYTHYWFRPPIIDSDVFEQIRIDFEKLILPLADLGVPLASWNGRNEAEICADYIRFNGVRHCGHPINEEIVVPYPVAEARGLGPTATAIAGVQYGLIHLAHRCCGGRCDHETFSFPRITNRRQRPRQDPEKKDLVGGFTKTAFKPYDIAVTAMLLIAKRHLRTQLVIHSNGADPQWSDAKDLCEAHLGYGHWFAIVEEPRIEFLPTSDGTQHGRKLFARVLVEMDPASFLLPG